MCYWFSIVCQIHHPASLQKKMSSVRNADNELSCTHFIGCPVYVLGASFQDGKKIPQWNPRVLVLASFLGIQTFTLAPYGSYVRGSPHHGGQNNKLKIIITVIPPGNTLPPTPAWMWGIVTVRSCA